MSILDKARGTAKVLKEIAEQKVRKLARLEAEKDVQTEKTLDCVEALEFVMNVLKEKGFVTEKQAQEYCELYICDDAGMYPPFYEYIDEVIKETNIGQKVKLVSTAVASNWYLYDDISKRAGSDCYVTFKQRHAFYDMLVIDMPKALKDIRDSYEQEENEFNAIVEQYKEENKEALAFYEQIKHCEKVYKKLDSMIHNHKYSAWTKQKLDSYNSELAKLEDK